MTTAAQDPHATLETHATRLEASLAAAERATPDQIPALLRDQSDILDTLFLVLLREGLSLTTVNLALRSQRQYRQTVEKIYKIPTEQKRKNFLQNQTEGHEKCKQ